MNPNHSTAEAAAAAQYNALAPVLAAPGPAAMGYPESKRSLPPSDRVRTAIGALIASQGGPTELARRIAALPDLPGGYRPPKPQFVQAWFARGFVSPEHVTQVLRLFPEVERAGLRTKLEDEMHLRTSRGSHLRKQAA